MGSILIMGNISGQKMDLSKSVYFFSDSISFAIVCYVSVYAPQFLKTGLQSEIYHTM